MYSVAVDYGEHRINRSGDIYCIVEGCKAEEKYAMIVCCFFYETPKRTNGRLNWNGWSWMARVKKIALWGRHIVTQPHCHEETLRTVNSQKCGDLSIVSEQNFSNLFTFSYSHSPPTQFRSIVLCRMLLLQHTLELAAYSSSRRSRRTIANSHAHWNTQITSR